MVDESEEFKLEPIGRDASPPLRVLLVDLNNFASFPTLAIGLLVASLRNAGFVVELISPLANDVPAALRERRETILNHLARRIRLSTSKPYQAMRDSGRRVRDHLVERPHPAVIRTTARALKSKPDIILLSAYLQHFKTVKRIGEIASEANVPLVVGGPTFNFVETADAWRSIPGLMAIVGAEMDLALPAFVSAACKKQNLLDFSGVMLADGRRSVPAQPLRDLDRVPVPDFSDFPWERYPLRVIPLMAGRGCQWSECVFCNDIASVNGRTYRSRSIETILAEVREQSLRHSTANFLFLDLKLNSNPAIFRGIIHGIQSAVYGAEWVGTVHVDLRADNGLTKKDLRDAAISGMRRISFGLESGSQRLLDAMKKGSSVERNSEFIRNAHEAGISIRCTMFSGFPGETAEDLENTAVFLERHCGLLDRVRFNDFVLPAKSEISVSMRDTKSAAGISVIRVDHQNAKSHYTNSATTGREYRKAKARVLNAVFEINRRDVRFSARAFDGLM